MNQLKESKLNMLGLGKVYTTFENSRKILRSLPKTWNAKVTAIQEAKDLTKLPFEELIGSLMTHEIIMKMHLEDESKKNKSVALKTIFLEVDPKDEDDLDENDIAYFSRKYKNFIKRKKYFKKHMSSQKESKDEKSKKDEKAMKATWDDSSVSESEVEKMVHLGLMAHSNKEDEHDDENVSSKHVCDCNEKEALLDKVRFLEHDVCEKDNLIKVLKENELNVLQDLDKAKETIKKLTISAQRLGRIIEVGKSYGDKRGLGYIDELSTPSSSKTTFVKASPIVPNLNMPNDVSNHVQSRLRTYLS
ncbi:zf-CCHC domain-containing protein/UBN2 domain-containing protein [Cucumis melo var. makuwa]|uniref:Zf-CCHC domain-containing protein/UBN2 domain-containing protein n=1 Tax=Cucumis melo var. makuwa TaxID=1194695 RepID=A0A5A7U923_CUCMM|nr:zf-CCHC domain-containing protein/UBN2 domain-containing protein [Cucumis melo var. makuwa]TYJ97960.1 zf-CCHC domain-containing protein/UBN2 domain-containing protein [Cucumis melo var. makuwa]